MKGCGQMNPVYGWEDFGIEPGTIYRINRPAPTPTELYQGSLFSNILLRIFIRKKKTKKKRRPSTHPLVLVLIPGNRLLSS